jgi:hypothetical protein
VARNDLLFVSVRLRDVAVGHEMRGKIQGRERPLNAKWHWE